MDNNFLKVLLFILSGILIWLFYKQSEELDYLRETIKIQDMAIQKQQFLIDYQKYYIESLENKSNKIYNPLFNNRI